MAQPASPPRFAAKSDPMAIARSGMVYLAQGEFDKALLLMETAQPYLPDVGWLHLNLAALLRKLRHPEVGQAMFRGFLERHPLEPVPDAPVLVMRGFDETYPHLGKAEEGRVYTTLRGGHFTLRYLLDDDAPKTQTFTIAGHRGFDAGKLPPFALMLNTMADADVEDASLRALSAWLADHPDTPLINHPDRVMATTRDGNYNRLQGMEGVRFPLTARLSFENAKAQEVERAISAQPFEPPLILRQTGTHTARTTALIDSRQALQDFVGSGLTGEFYAIAFHDLRWNGTDLFRKLRLFHIDGVFYPVVCHLDHVWNVHGGNRKDVMRGNVALMAEEQRFLSDWQSYCGPRATDALHQLARATGLEFFGIDFTLTEEGDVFIYELNASMRHSFDHARNFPYKLPYDQAISAAFQAMVRSRLAASQTPNQED